MLLLLSTFLSSQLFVNGQPLQFKRLTVNEGLSQNSVYDIKFDKFGFLWAGTADGLNRYDGYSFIQYRKSGVKNLRLNNTSVFNIACDGEGKIWIAGSEGIEVLNPLNHAVHLLMSQPTLSKGASWHYDSSRQSMLLFIQGKGVLEYDCRTMQGTRIDFASANEAITGFYYSMSIFPLGSPGQFILFSRGRSFIYILDLTAHTLIKHELFPSTNDYLTGNVSVYGAGNFVFTANIDNASCLVEMDGRTRKFLRKKNASYLYGDPFFKSTLYVPALQKIIVSDFHKGLLFYDTAFNEINNYPNSTVLSSSINDVAFQCLLIKDNCLWLGSDPNGITYSNLSPQLFHHFKNTYSSSAPVVKGIFTDAEDRVYSCILFDGVQVFDKNGNYLNELKKIGGHGNEPLHFQAFSNVLAVEKNKVFIRCSNYLGFYNTASGDAYNYLYSFLQQAGTKQYDDIYNAAAVINPGSLLLGSRNTVWHASFTEKNVSLQQKDSVKDPVTSLFAIDTDHFFIGTEEGLYFSSKGVKTYYDQIGKLLIKHITKDSFGNYWISTPGGLWQLNAQLQVVTQYTTDKGLPNNFIYGALSSQHTLWISSNLGLSAMDIASGIFTNYTVADGLQSNEFNSGAFWKSDNGQLYFGGINGVTQIDASVKLTPNHIIPVIITQLKVNDKIWNADTAAWSIKDLKLPYTSNTVSFDFSGILPSQSQQLEYRYKMEGADNDWVYAGKNRVVRYADLSPGHYTFKVAASLNNKDWGNTTSIFIDITPPFWKTFWFRALLVLSSLIILWFAIRWYNERRYKKQMENIKLQQQLEEERQRISRDLHDNMGAYTSALIANVEKLKSKTGENEELLKMQSNAEQILGSLRETIWVLNNKEISIADFSDGFKNYCFKLLKNFEHIAFDAREDIMVNGTLSASVAVHLNKILQEAVQNIIKHSNATAISYSISYNHTLKITLSDNGSGFDLVDIKKGNGLENMQWRASEAGAVIEIISSPQKGTVVSIVK